MAKRENKHEPLSAEPSEHPLITSNTYKKLTRDRVEREEKGERRGKDERRVEGRGEMADVVFRNSPWVNVGRRRQEERRMAD